MATIYRKTDKGVEEIATRAHKLSPRLRTALIMVDGKRDDTQLGGLISVQAEEALQALLDQGFIEVLAVAATARSEARASSSAASSGSEAPAPSRKSSSSSVPPFDVLRRDAVRTLTDLVGPLGEALAMRMEKANSPDELRPLLEVAAQVVRNTRGTQAASDFAARFTQALR